MHVVINTCRAYCWESVIHDHHNCKAIWMPEIGEILSLLQAIISYHKDANAVSIIKHYIIFWFHVVTPSEHYHLVYK